MKRMIYFEVAKDGQMVETFSRMMRADEIGEQVTKLRRRFKAAVVIVVHPDFAPGEEA